MLYRRIDRRVDEQIDRGLVEENRRLVAAGYSYDLPAMSGLGYRQIGSYLHGEVPLERAVELLKFATHRFARQQYTWFRLDDPRIHWLEGDGALDRVSHLVDRHLEDCAWSSTRRTASATTSS